MPKDVRLKKKYAEFGRVALVIAVLLTANFIHAQSEPEQLKPILGRQLQNAEVTVFQLRQYLMKHVPQLSIPASAQEWTAKAKQIREHLLTDVVFHGWPADWVNAPPRFECPQTIETGKGYRIRKCRYEIVPGFQSAALLYEPDNVSGKVPAILNVNGHIGPLGKAIEYKQKRCINYAKQGMLALNLEWLDFGELSDPANDHGYAAHLDLAGLNGVGLFYLAMRRGLDYLYEHPNVDRRRIGVTGLSGGGWQTIVLSSLDERVLLAAPVAGYCSLTTSIEQPDYMGNDIEENPTDFRDGVDYTHLTAMRAPRPTLLIYNAEDTVFRGPIVKPYIFDQVQPFFRLFGKEDVFSWHENTDPGTHNYQLDNRQQSYQFFNRYFGLPGTGRETPAGAEIMSYDQLVVGLPKNNLTILGLARERARKIQRPPMGAETAERSRLTALVRYKPVTVKHAWAVASTKNKGVETHSYQFQLSNDLSANGIIVKGTMTPGNAPATIVLHDKGRTWAAAEVSDRVNRDEQVLALDLLFTGDASPEKPGSPPRPGNDTVPEYTQMLASVGERPIGMEAAQLVGIAHWLRDISGASQIRLESTGIRNQVAALTASALDPTLFSQVVIFDGMRSLSYLLDAPVTYEAAPDLFCLDLYKDFDLDRLATLAQPTKISQMYADENPK
jgi:dienelactone hydrolase